MLGRSKLLRTCALFTVPMLLALGAAQNANAVLIDFETAPLGDFASYSESGVTFTPVAPGTLLSVLQLSFGRGIVGNAPSFQPVRADIAGGASLVSVVLGDVSDDTDSLFLNAFDGSDTLIGSDTFFLNGAGTHTLSVALANIAYVIVGSVSTINNSSIMLDSFMFEPARVSVPEPATLSLVALGLLGLGAARRRRKGSPA